jgi:hypothetical protein
VEFDKNPVWTKERLFELSELTGLSEAQIYKWGWDQRKKAESEPLNIEPPVIEPIPLKKREVKQKEKATAKNENSLVDSACKIRLDFNKVADTLPPKPSVLPSAPSAPPKA